MDRKLLNEIVNLKEKRQILMAECDSTINENLFSRTELAQIKEHRNDHQASIELEVVNLWIKEDERLFMES